MLICLTRFRSTYFKWVLIEWVVIYAFHLVIYRRKSHTEWIPLHINTYELNLIVLKCIQSVTISHQNTYALRYNSMLSLILRKLGLISGVVCQQSEMSWARSMWINLTSYEIQWKPLTGFENEIDCAKEKVRMVLTPTRLN